MNSGIQTTDDQLDLANIRATLRAANFGEVMSILLQSERHRELTLGAIAQQIVPAFLSDQYVLARAVPDKPGAPGTPVGFAFWASVSEAVAERICRTTGASMVLSPEDWKSGDMVVILDVVAPAKIGPQVIEKIRDKEGSDKRYFLLIAGCEGKPTLQPLPA